jgi:Zn finger protein HypA/HybF involved in hydrogenase expression
MDYKFKMIQGKKVPVTEDGDFFCMKCQEAFTPKVELPRYCPVCKNPKWYRPRKYKKVISDE